MYNGHSPSVGIPFSQTTYHWHPFVGCGKTPKSELGQANQGASVVVVVVDVVVVVVVVVVVEVDVVPTVVAPGPVAQVATAGSLQ